MGGLVVEPLKSRASVQAYLPVSPWYHGLLMGALSRALLKAESRSKSGFREVALTGQLSNSELAKRLRRLMKQRES